MKLLFECSGEKSLMSSCVTVMREGFVLLLISVLACLFLNFIAGTTSNPDNQDSLGIYIGLDAQSPDQPIAKFSQFNLSSMEKVLTNFHLFIGISC